MQTIGTQEFTTVDGSKIKVPVVESAIYGQMWAPATFLQFAAIVEQIANVCGDIQGWRGQAGDWHLDSSAVRRLI